MVTKLPIEYDGSGFAGWAAQPGRPQLGIARSSLVAVADACTGRHVVLSGFALLGLNLGAGAPDGDWDVTLFCRNCADKRFVTYIEPYPLISTDYGQQFGADSFRTVGVTFRKTF